MRGGATFGSALACVLIALLSVSRSAAAESDAAARVDDCRRAVLEVTRSASGTGARALDRWEENWLAFGDGIVDATATPCASSRNLLLDAARFHAEHGHGARALSAYQTLLAWKLAPASWVPGIVHEMSLVLAGMGRPGEGAMFSRSLVEHLTRISDSERRRAVLDAVRFAALAGDSATASDMAKFVLERYAESQWAPEAVVLAEIVTDPQEGASLLDDDTVAWIDERATEEVRAAAHAHLSFALSDAAKSEREAALAVEAWTRASTRTRDGAPPIADALRSTVARAALSLADRHATRLEVILSPGPRDSAASFRDLGAFEARLASIQDEAKKIDDEYAWLLDTRIGLSSEKGIVAASRIGSLLERVVRVVEGWPAAPQWKASKWERERYAKLRTGAITDFRSRARGVFTDCVALARAAGFLSEGAVDCEAGLVRTGGTGKPALEEIVPGLMVGRDAMRASDWQPVP